MSFIEHVHMLKDEDPKEILKNKLYKVMLILLCVKPTWTSLLVDVVSQLIKLDHDQVD